MGSSSNARSGVSYNATVAHLRRVLGGFVPGYGDAQLSNGHTRSTCLRRSYRRLSLLVR